ncbi:MAG: hypothetical protein GY866_35300 [Proteobacteria bacterium]|nr:hypothetical protein [Pseudomonadota bacterium]
MKIFRLIFPENSRDFYGKRWLNVVLRSVHLCGACGYAGGVLLDVTSEPVRIFYLVTAISGLIMMAIDIISNGIWIIQNRGWLIILKIFLLGQLPLIAPYEKWGLLGIVVLSSLVSHATANFRYYSPLHRRKIEKL